MPELTLRLDDNERVIGIGQEAAEASRQRWLAKDEADRAVTERLGSESARDAAIAYLNPYSDQAAGEAATSEGEPFSFIDANDEVALAVRTAGGSELLPTYFGASKVGLAQGGKVSDAIKFVTPQMFGAVGDGTTDDTAAFQDALDSGLPNVWPIGEYLITDTLLLEPGVVIIGDGGKANYDESPVKIRFTPTTKRDLFNWRSPTSEAPYRFGGCHIEGFCIRGFGPGADACLDLPLLYNGLIDFYAFAGVDKWIKLRRWQDCIVKGGVQGFRVAGVEFEKANSVADPASDVTTTTTIDAYVSQGPVAYYTATRSVTAAYIRGTIESVDKATDIATGNILYIDVYTENVPRTDAGSAWEYGKTGDGGQFETALHLNLRPGIGHSGGTLDNANLVDVGNVRLLKLSGYAFLYKTLLKTSSDTRRVIINGLDTENIEAFSTVGGIADYSKIERQAFTPSTMVETPGGASFIAGGTQLPTLQLTEVERASIAPDKLFADKALHGKIIRRDRDGNFSPPIGMLQTSSIGGPWTFQGGRTVPGEMVIYTGGEPGAPWGFKCTRFGKDTANDYALCSTTSGSPVITNPTVGTFYLCEVGDYVTVSAGFGDAVAQRRVIARSADLTSITVDSNATSTVSGTVGVSTEVHKLLPVGQQGHRETGADPTGALAPFFVGEEVFRTDTSNWYKATGPNTANWKLLT